MVSLRIVRFVVLGLVFARLSAPSSAQALFFDKVFSAVEKTVKRVSEKAADTVRSAVGKGRGLGKKAMDAVSRVGGDAFKRIQKLAKSGPGAGKKVRDALRALSGQAMDAVRKAVGAGKGIAKKFGAAIKDTLHKAVEGARGFAKAVGGAIGKGLDALKNLAKGLTGGLAGLPEVFTKLAGMLKLGALKSPQQLLPALMKLPETGLKLFDLLQKPFAKAMKHAFPGAGELGKLLSGAAKTLGQLLKPGGASKLVNGMIDGAFNKVTDFAMKAVERAMTVREELRKLLTLEGLQSPFDPRHDKQITRFLDLLLEPIEGGMMSLFGKLIPKPILALARKLGLEPMRKAMLFGARLFIVGRTGLVKLAGVVVPYLMKGAVGAHAALKKLPIPSFVKELVLTGFDKFHEMFGGLLGTLANTVAPELTKKLTEAMKSLGAAHADVAGLTTQLASLQAKSPAELLQKVAGLTVSGPSSPAAKARAAKAKAAYEAAKKKAAAVRKAAIEATRKGTDAQAQKATEAIANAEAAVEHAANDLAKVDAVFAKRKVVGAVWEVIAKALMKALWDPMAGFSDLISAAAVRILETVCDVVLAVVAAVLGVIPVCIDWCPLIVETIHVVVNVAWAAVGVLRSVVMSVVLPELRMLLEDQLVSLRGMFMRMWEDPKTRGTMQAFGKVIDDVSKMAAPFMKRLGKVGDTLALGPAALASGPLGGMFKKVFPPAFWAAISRAINAGMQLLREAAMQGAVAVAKMVASKGKSGGASAMKKLSPKEIAKTILEALREPVIDFLAAAIPNDKVRLALTEGFKAASKPFASEPMKFLNPKGILQLVGKAVYAARKPLSEFLTDRLRVDGLAASMEKGLVEVSKLLEQPSQAMVLLRGGLPGILRKAIFIAKDGLVGLFIKGLPTAELKAEMKASLLKAFTILETPGELTRVFRKGVKGVLARLIELAHGPITALLLKDFPEGSVKSSIRTVLKSAGEKLSDDKTLARLAKGGLLGVAGQIFKQPNVATALADVMTGWLGESADRQKLKADVGKAIAEVAGKLEAGTLRGVLSQLGLRGLFDKFGRPVATYLVARLTAGLDPPQLGAALRESVEEALAGFGKKKSIAEVLKGVGHALLSNFKAYVEDLLARGAELFSTKFAALEPVLRAVLASMDEAAVAGSRLVTELRGGLGKLSAALKTASVSLPARRGVTR